MRDKWNNLRLATKTSFVLITVLCLILISINIFSGLYTKNLISQKVDKQLQERLHQVKEELITYDNLLKTTANGLFEAFNVQFEEIEIDKKKYVDVNGIKTPKLSNNGILLNNNFNYVDNYTKIKGSTATVFAKMGDDFVRITTSLKRPDGTRTLGTFLGKKSPAYNAIMNKKRYFGTAHLFGNEYMAVYDPIIKNNEVIGILYVGYNYTRSFENLKKRLKSITIGKTGYLYILSYKDKSKGRYILHPKKEGKTSNNLSYIKQMYKLKNGSITYNEGENSVIFEQYKDRKWILVFKTTIEEFLEESSKFALILLIISLFSIAVISLLILYIIRNIVVAPLHNLQDGLKKFFDYLNKKSDSTEKINVKSNDEIGLMSKLINDNISIIEKNIEIDNHLIKDTVSVANQVKIGYLDKRIMQSSNNPSLNELKNVVNDMLQSTEKNLSEAKKVLSSFTDFDYTVTLDTSLAQADMKKLYSDINTLGNSISLMLKDNLQTGSVLNTNSNKLSEITNKLSNSSNEQAASLEETAASLEELTSSMSNNENNMNHISITANNLLKEIKSGRELASNTATAMDSINEQTQSIAEAITIIDQIAFQTNILSLNAAVEAATAGEAGKGFAVVAQEVRNLASRSAEAAKEIKDLVENATLKTDEGKTTAKKMIAGYVSLDENVHKNAEMMEDVSSNFKEQVRGIEQINDAIASLDKLTQENAAVANTASNIAKETDKISNHILRETENKKFNKDYK